jgi:hypothetical protein
VALIGRRHGMRFFPLIDGGHRVGLYLCCSLPLAAQAKHRPARYPTYRDRDEMKLLHSLIDAPVAISLLRNL